FTARKGARPPVEVEIVQSDAEKKVKPATDLVQYLSPRIGAPAGRLKFVEEHAEFIEVELANFVEVLAGNLEKKSRRAHARSVALGAELPDHPFVQPLLHARVRFATLPVPTVPSFDPSRDTGEADLLPDTVVAPFLCLRRRQHLDFFRFDAVKDGSARFFRQLSPRRLKRKVHRLREAVHHLPIPRVGVVFESFAYEATITNASAWIGDQELRVCELVYSEPTTCAARAFRIVEHEIIRSDISIDEMVCRAAQ